MSENTNPTRRRPTREVMQRLLGAKGASVELTQTELLEDVDGLPLGVATTRSSGTLAVSLELLGWTQDEWNNPEITE